MRPMRLVLALAAVLCLAPTTASAGGKTPSFPDGEFFFVDKTSFDKITSEANIDQAFDEYCLAARVAYTDQESTPNRRVEFLIHSLGDIESETATRVDGTFVTVDLTLTVLYHPSVVAFEAPIFQQTIQPTCKLEGSVLKSGDKHKVTLSCDVGPNLSAFAIPPTTPAPLCGIATPPPFPCGPDITQAEMVATVASALGKKKVVKLDLVEGTLTVKHNGDPMPDGFPEDFITALACPTSSDAPPSED